MLERLPRIPVTCRNASANAYKPLSFLSRRKDISIADIVLKVHTIHVQLVDNNIVKIEILSGTEGGWGALPPPPSPGPLRREFVGKLVRVCFLDLKKNCSCSVIVVRFWSRSRSPSWQCSFKSVTVQWLILVAFVSITANFSRLRWTDVWRRKLESLESLHPF